MLTDFNRITNIQFFKSATQVKIPLYFFEEIHFEFAYNHTNYVFGPGTKNIILRHVLLNVTWILAYNILIEMDDNNNRVCKTYK